MATPETSLSRTARARDTSISVGSVPWKATRRQSVPRPGDIGGLRQHGPSSAPRRSYRTTSRTRNGGTCERLKSFGTFAPIGRCIVTADEIAGPNDLEVRFRVSGQLRHDYNTGDMGHPVPELVEWASAIMTLNSGDLIGCGTNHEGLGPLQDGDRAEIEIAGIGRMVVNVIDPLKRSWERGVYMGRDSTHPDNLNPAEPSGR